MSQRVSISIDELPRTSSILDGHDYSSQIIRRIAGVPILLDPSGCPHSSLFRIEHDDKVISLTDRCDNGNAVELGNKLDYAYRNWDGFLKTFFLKIVTINGRCYKLSNHSKTLSIKFQAGGKVLPFLHLLSSHYFYVDDLSVTRTGERELELSGTGRKPTILIKRIGNRWVDVLSFLLGRTKASCNTNMPISVERHCKSKQLYRGSSGIEMLLVFSNRQSPFFTDEEARKNIFSLIDGEDVRRLLSPRLENPSFNYAVRKPDNRSKDAVKVSMSYDNYYPNKRVAKLISHQVSSPGTYSLQLTQSEFFSPQSDRADIHLLLMPNTFNDSIFTYYQLALLTGLGSRTRLQEFLSILSKYFSGVISRSAFKGEAGKLFAETASFLPIGRLSSSFFMRNDFMEETIKERMLNVLLER